LQNVTEYIREKENRLLLQKENENQNYAIAILLHADLQHVGRIFCAGNGQSYKIDL
jgi:hypothetical protein